MGDFVVVVIAEKPSVARDIAAVLGATKKRATSLEGNGYVVTWAIGHLVSIASPEKMDASWKQWRWDRLPMIPKEWLLEVLPQTTGHFEAIKEILNRPDTERIVCATDAGREGELIFRYIMVQSGCTKPVERLWISSLTPQAIRTGFSRLRPGADYDNLGNAALARARADWLVGMNLSRAYTLRHKSDVLSVGRVQTPTLALLVERERAISSFVPEKYCEVRATFGNAPNQSYEALWFDPETVQQDSRKADRLPADQVLAKEIQKRCRGKTGVVTQCTGTSRSQPPPLLYDLTELQRHANRLYGMTAQDVLKHAQSLYERRKMITYPRTDSRYLSRDVASQIAPVLKAITPHYPQASIEEKATISSRFVNDAKVTDHHAIIPTSVVASGLTQPEAQLYDMICRRLLMTFLADLKTQVTNVVTQVVSPEHRDHFRASGTVVVEAGWKVLELYAQRGKKKKSSKQEEETQLPDGLSKGQQYPVTSIGIQGKETSPPRFFTDASLLTAMETAGKLLEDQEFQEAMKERGLGTPATRAATIELLIQRNYAERSGKSLRATPKGCQLIDEVNEKVKSPAMTGEWERDLKLMEQGEGTLQEFMLRVEEYVQEVVQLARFGKRQIQTQAQKTQAQQILAEAKTPTMLIQAARQSARGQNSLVTGFQPSHFLAAAQAAFLARGKVGLFFSMDDSLPQTLAGTGFQVDILTPNRQRKELRAAGLALAANRLDILVVSPLALQMPGVLEMLVKSAPTLIAIDERASSSGLDILMGHCTNALRGSPTLIAHRLCSRAVLSGYRHIYQSPFPTEQIPMEILSQPKERQLSTLQELRQSPSFTSMVIRTNTADEAEKLHQGLGKECILHHLQMTPDKRKQALQDYTTHPSPLLITTTPIHRLNIHASLYIHLGAPPRLDDLLDDMTHTSHLILLCPPREGIRSILAMEQPNEKLLEETLAQIPQDGIDLETFYRTAGRPPEHTAILTRHLCNYRALYLDLDGKLVRGHPDWKKNLAITRQMRLGQEVQDFLSTTGCRYQTLRQLCAHSPTTQCGICDHCAPTQCILRHFRKPTPQELALAQTIAHNLKTPTTSGQLYEACCPESPRGLFEKILSSMHNAGLLQIQRNRYEKNQKTIIVRQITPTTIQQTAWDRLVVEVTD